MRRSEHNALRTRIDGRYCVYCGERPNTDEHFPPVSHGLGGFILPACNECNRLAGAEWPRDFAERAGYVKRRLTQRYRATLPLTVDALLAEDEDRWADLIHEEKIRRRKDARLEWDAMLYLRSIAGEADLKAIDDLKQVEESASPVDEAPPPLDPQPEPALPTKGRSISLIRLVWTKAAQRGLTLRQSGEGYQLRDTRTGEFIALGDRSADSWSLDELNDYLNHTSRPLTYEGAWDEWVRDPDSSAEDEPKRFAERPYYSSTELHKRAVAADPLKARQNRARRHAQKRGLRLYTSRSKQRRYGTPLDENTLVWADKGTVAYRGTLEEIETYLTAPKQTIMALRAGEAPKGGAS